MKQENKLIVANQSWAKSIPKWIKDEIASERIMNGLIDIATQKNTAQDVGDAEIVAYLMTASLNGPLNYDNTHIYLYVGAKLMLKAKKIKEEEDLPDFMQEIYKKGLSEWEKTQLNDLRSTIRQARGKVSHPLFDILKELKGGIKR